MDEQPTAAGGLGATKVLKITLRPPRRAISNIEQDFKAWEAYPRRLTIEMNCEARAVIDAVPVERR